jgi:hypothetical protein
MYFANLDQDRIIHEFAEALPCVVDFILVAKGGVGDDVDTLLLVSFKEVVLL